MRRDPLPHQHFRLARKIPFRWQSPIEKTRASTAIADEIAAYLAKGGEITSVPVGASGVPEQ